MGILFSCFIIDNYRPNRYCVKTYFGHLEWVRSVSPSEDGKWLITSSNDQVCIAHFERVNVERLSRKA